MENEALAPRCGDFAARRRCALSFSPLTWLAGSLPDPSFYPQEAAPAMASGKAGGRRPRRSALLEARLAGILQRVQSDLEHLTLTLPGEAYRADAAINWGRAWFARWACAPACFPRFCWIPDPGCRETLLYARRGVSRAKTFVIAAISKPSPTAVAVDCFFPKCKLTRCQGARSSTLLRRRATTPGPCWVSWSRRSI